MGSNPTNNPNKGDSLTDPNALLMGGGVPAIKPTNKNVPVRIDKITAVEAVQQTDIKTRAPLFYDNGQAKMQIVVTGYTSERDPERSNDDGMRKLYVKGQARVAVREAVIEAGAEGLEIGGALALVWYDDKAATQPGMSPQKLHRAQYQRPTADAVAASSPPADLFASTSGDDIL